ncbi:MAG: DNA primase [Patescibacteria group bacterium]|nr:DNA primase [Patescibacteria group bacterium]
MAKDIDLIKEKIELVDFLRSYLTLSPAGKNFKAICPFHQEKTPSFIVSPERQIWHCFGCGAGGDVIGFAMRYENLEFPEALRFLAERAGITLQSMGLQAEREFGALFDIHEAAKEFYKQELFKNKNAQDYLKNRGLMKDTIDEFELGFAPGGEALTVYLIHKGFDIQDIVRAGLTNKNTSGLYRDRFQSRLIFPICNQVGRTIAFTGRFLESLVRGPSDMPKYLNSPETPIFNKSKALYGFHKSKNEIARAKSVLLVEGQMDFLMSWQTGVKNAVSVSGTGLTAYHLERLRRLADTVILSFDNDEAGLKALERSLEAISAFDFHVKAMDLGKYKDPAEAVKENPENFKKVVAETKPAFTYIFSHYFKKGESDGDRVSEKRLLRYLLQLIKKVKSAVEQNSLIRELAKFSGISETVLLSEISEMPDEKIPQRGVEEQEENVKVSNERINLIADRLLAIAFSGDDFFERTKKYIEFLPLIYRKVFNDPKSSEAAKFQMLSSMIQSEDQKEINEEFGELLIELQIESLKKERLDLQSKSREMKVKKGDNEEESPELMEKFSLLSKRIDDLKNRVKT